MSEKLLSSEAIGADIREDEEQAVKFQEIVDMLIAAGYFRARIKVLSNFDKVIGGLTWCIESCNFDVDIDLLYHENLTIGQKIALTEKIVAVLPKMNCPHRIEPHQIQGLDCIHIFPVVQWLITQSMKTREEMAEFVQAYANYQCEKNLLVDQKDFCIEDWQTVEEADKTSRKYKRQGAPPNDLEMRLKSTLLEYGTDLNRFLQISKEETPSSTESQVESHGTDLMKTMAVVEGNSGLLNATTVGNIVNTQVQEIGNVVESFANFQISDNQDESSESKTIKTLEKRKVNLQKKLDDLIQEKQRLLGEITDLNDKLEKIRSDRKAVENAFSKMREMETGENIGMLRRLKELLSVYDGLKDQDIKFREQCKTDLVNLQSLIEEFEKDEPQKEEQMQEYEKQKEIINKLRLQLAKKNRQVALMARQLDDVPGRSELTQYQKRFMELYNQVSAKHIETKQYYTLYNTLDDTKLYLTKELSILQSVQDCYKETDNSTKNNEGFLQQFQAIVNGVAQNKEKVEKRYADEVARRDELRDKLSTLKEQQRRYISVAQYLVSQCQLNERLLSQLRAKS